MKITEDQAVSLLLGGKVVGVPTETVYGLAASLPCEEAIEAIFSLKGRPRANPLIVHCSTLEEATRFASFSPGAIRLAHSFWPGPLTLVLPALSPVSETVRAGLSTVAIRVPSHPIISRILQKTGPLVAPSANLSGRPSSTNASHVEEDFGPHFPVVDGGECPNGIESTILLQRGEGWALGRVGAIPTRSLEAVLGEKLPSEKGEKPSCPGQMFRHYSPQASLELIFERREVYPKVMVGFSDRLYPGCSRLLPLGDSNDPKTIAFRLYEVLRSLDREGIAQAGVDFSFEKEGEFQAIGERLCKASGIEFA